MAVTNTVKLLNDLSSLIVSGIDLVKTRDYFKAIALAGKIMAILPEAKAALPELEQVDTAEAAEICAAAYSAVSKIVAAA